MPAVFLCNRIALWYVYKRYETELVIQLYYMQTIIMILEIIQVSEI